MAIAGLAAMALAAAGIGVAVAGRHLGYPLLERFVGPGVTLAGALLWVAYRARRGRGR